MKIIPAVSISDGSVVSVKDGAYVAHMTPDGKCLEPLDLFLSLKEKYGNVYITDIQGMERNEPDLKLLQKTSPFLPVWMHAGSRDIMGIMDVLVAGVFKAVVGTRNITSLGILEEAHEMTDNIVVSMDHDSEVLCPGKVLKDMDLENMARNIADIGIETAVYFDLGRNFGKNEINLNNVRRLHDHFAEVYVAGLASKEDIQRLENLSVTGVIADFKSLEDWKITGNPDDWEWSAPVNLEDIE